MELTALGIFAILILVIVMWRPISVVRKEVPEALTDGIRHGTKILHVNIMEDEVELNSRAKKIKAAHDAEDWVDLDSLWNDMHPANK